MMIEIPELAALRRDPARWERTVRGALERIDPGLRARRREVGAIETIGVWARPLVAAAALVAALLAPAALRSDGGPDAAAELAAYSRAAVQGAEPPAPETLLRAVSPR